MSVTDNENSFTSCHVYIVFACVPLDVSCQIWGARGGSLSVGGIRQANLFPGNDIRDAVSRAVLQGNSK